VTRWLVIALAAAALAASCFVDRRSSEFECETDADCADIAGGSRECNGNKLCVVVDCPDICDSCTGDNVCNITCNNASKCSNLDCPNNFSCSLSCSQDCKNLECDDGCTVMCSANADCGPIDCGVNETCNCTATGNGTCL
jgi:hypothetical protein